MFTVNEKSSLNNTIHFFFNPLLSFSLQLLASVFRSDCHLILEGLENLAFTKIRTGDLERAIQFYNTIIRLQETVHGKQSRPYNENIGLLGIVLMTMHKYPEATECFMVLQRWQEGNLPKTDPMVTIINNLLTTVGKKSRGVSTWI
jgi:hypothetical protein